MSNMDYRQYHFDNEAKNMIDKYEQRGLSNKDILKKVVAELLIKIDTLERLIDTLERLKKDK